MIKLVYKPEAKKKIELHLSAKGKSGKSVMRPACGGDVKVSRAIETDERYVSRLAAGKGKSKRLCSKCKALLGD